MIKKYSWDIPDVQSVPLSDNALLQVGRICRSIAEVEVCLNCIIMQFTKMHPRHFDICLGAAGIRAKLSIIENLSKFTGEKALKLYKTIFNHQFIDALSCRNYLAHGAYIGKASSGEFLFLSNAAIIDKHYSTDESFAVVSPILGYSEENLSSLAGSLDKFIPLVAENYRIKSLRENYLQPDLVRHKHARKSSSKRKGRSGPPPPSEA